jgi:acyl carrier protein
MNHPLADIQDQDKVQDALVAYLRGIKPDAIPESTNVSQLKISRILDSVDMLALIVQLETMFAIQIKDEDVLARNFETLGSLTAFVSRKLARPGKTEDFFAE